MITYNILIASILTLALGGCSTSVKLVVKNNTPSPLSARVIVFDKQDVRQPRDVGIGEISSGAEAETIFDVEHDGSFQVVGEANDNLPVANSGKISVGAKPNPQEKRVTLNTYIKQLDGENSLNTIASSFKKLGMDLGATPLPLKTALETRIGALVVADKGGEGVAGKIYYSVPPNVFGVKVLKLDDIEDIPTDETNQVDSSGATAVKASAQFGPLAQFGASFETGSIYQMKWTLRGFGPLQKIEDPERDPSKLFSKLSEYQLNQIKSNLAAHVNAKIYYINSYYVLRSADLYVKKATTAKVDGDLKSAIMSSGSVYSFDNSSEFRYSYGPVILNFWGEEYNLVEIANPQKNVTTIAGTPAVGTQKLPVLIPTMQATPPLSNLKAEDGVFQSNP